MSKLHDTLSALKSIDDVTVVNANEVEALERKLGVMFGHYSLLIMVAPKKPRGLYTAEELQNEMIKLKGAIPGVPYVYNYEKSENSTIHFGCLEYEDTSEESIIGRTRHHTVTVYPNEVYARDLLGGLKSKLPNNARWEADSNTLDQYRRIAERKRELGLFNKIKLVLASFYK